jgi:hypothetical protein
MLMRILSVVLGVAMVFVGFVTVWNRDAMAQRMAKYYADMGRIAPWMYPGRLKEGLADESFWRPFQIPIGVVHKASSLVSPLRPVWRSCSFCRY